MKLIHNYYHINNKTKKNKLIRELTISQDYCKPMHNRSKKDNRRRIKGYLTQNKNIKLLVITKYIQNKQWIDKGSGHLTYETYNNSPCYFIYDLCRAVKPKYIKSKKERISPIKYVIDELTFFVKKLNMNEIFIKISKKNDTNKLIMIYNSYNFHKIEETDDFIILKKNINN